MKLLLLIIISMFSISNVFGQSIINLNKNLSKVIGTYQTSELYPGQCRFSFCESKILVSQMSMSEISVQSDSTDLNCSLNHDDVFDAYAENEGIDTYLSYECRDLGNVESEYRVAFKNFKGRVYLYILEMSEYEKSAHSVVRYIKL